jgi:hypothetical protein
MERIEVKCAGLHITAASEICYLYMHECVCCMYVILCICMYTERETEREQRLKHFPWKNLENIFYI